MTADKKVFPSHDLLFIPSLVIQCESSRKLTDFGGGMLKPLGRTDPAKEHQSGTWNGYTHYLFLAVVIWRVIQLSKCNAL